MTDEFSDDDMVEDETFDLDNPEDRPLYPPEDEADEPDEPEETGDAGESEDMSTDASVQERAESAKDKMRKGRKAKEVRNEPTKPVLTNPKGARTAKKATTTPKAPKKAASPAKKAPSPARKAPKKAAAKSTDRVIAMRGAAILLRQVGDPTRAAVIELLADGPQNVTEICDALGGISQPALSHHLALLRHGRIISPTREGKHNFYALEKIGVELASIIRTLSASA